MKKAKALVMFLAIMAFSSSISMAAEAIMTKRHVDSNTYNVIANARKDTQTNYGDIQITEIYTADGDVSSYEAIYVRACSADASRVTATKGTWVLVPIQSAYQSPGAIVPLYGKGRNPALDCKVSGYWNVH